MSELIFRSLKPTDLSQMYRSFIEAFSQYSVNMSMPREAFDQRMVGKLNLNYDLSPGAFDGDKLVGFIFHAINVHEGKLTAYNGGTGVIPGYWGQGITSKLHDFIIPKLRDQKVERCLLEVITNNDQGIKAYKKVGFLKTKKFKCFKLNSKLPRISSNDKIRIEIQANPDFSKYEEFVQWQVSMLDNFEQLKYNLEDETTLEAYVGDELVGYLILQLKLGRVSQFSVKNEHRQKGIGSALMTKASELSSVSTLTVLNVEEQAAPIISFLEKLGFENQIDQWEMELGL